MTVETRQRGISELHQATNSFKVHTPFSFLRDFINEAATKKPRVWIKTMTFQQGHSTLPIINSLKKSARRGADTVFRADRLSSRISAKASPGQKELDATVMSDLEDSGVKVDLVNQPKAIQRFVPFLGPFMGRNHIKNWMVGNVAWFGGMNFENSNFGNLDFMVKITKPEIVRALAREFTRKDKPRIDYMEYCDSKTKLIVDVGRRGESLILDKATELIDNAQESIHAFSLLLPDGKLVSALERARKRGIDISIVTTKHDALGVSISRYIQKAYRIFFERFHDQIPLIQDDSIVHAKLLIVDKKYVLFGSHNLSTLGVLAGTEEIAILSEDPELVRSLEEFFQSQVNRIRSGKKFTEEVLSDES